MQAAGPGSTPPRRNRRPRRRELFCPAHSEQLLQGNGRKYFLHLLSPDELRQRGMSEKRARLVLNAYPVLVLSNEWLEELYCPECGQSRWCHLIRQDRAVYAVRWASRELWQQVAHVDPVAGNPSVSQYSAREARRRSGSRYFDPA